MLLHLLGPWLFCVWVCVCCFFFLSSCLWKGFPGADCCMTRLAGTRDSSKNNNLVNWERSLTWMRVFLLIPPGWDFVVIRGMLGIHNPAEKTQSSLAHHSWGSCLLLLFSQSFRGGISLRLMATVTFSSLVFPDWRLKSLSAQKCILLVFFPPQMFEINFAEMCMQASTQSLSVLAWYLSVKCTQETAFAIFSFLLGNNSEKGYLLKENL